MKKVQTADRSFQTIHWVLCDNMEPLNPKCKMDEVEEMENEAWE